MAMAIATTMRRVAIDGDDGGGDDGDDDGHVRMLCNDLLCFVMLSCAILRTYAMAMALAATMTRVPIDGDDDGDDDDDDDGYADHGNFVFLHRNGRKGVTRSVVAACGKRHRKYL